MIHYDLPMEEYLAHPAIGSSTLKNIMLTAADYKAALERKNDDTKSTSLGTAVHSVILEPEKFLSEYALQPEDWGPKNVGEGRKKWDAFKKENQGKTVIGFDDAQFLARVQLACSQNPFLKVHRINGKPECTGFTQYSEKIGLKARADLLGKDIIWDVKTTSESVDDDNLFKLVFNSGYHFQAAHHMHVFNALEAQIKSFGWIFISTKTPAVHIRMVQAPEILLKWARNDHQYALNKLEKCLETNDWSGYPQQIHELEIPEWARKMYE